MAHKRNELVTLGSPPAFAQGKCSLTAWARSGPHGHWGTWGKHTFTESSGRLALVHPVSGSALIPASMESSCCVSFPAAGCSTPKKTLSKGQECPQDYSLGMM